MQDADIDIARRTPLQRITTLAHDRLGIPTRR
jgi:hypothetical protein